MGPMGGANGAHGAPRLQRVTVFGWSGGTEGRSGDWQGLWRVTSEAQSTDFLERMRLSLQCNFEIGQM